MTTYADPTRCPDCRAVLPHDPQACRVCLLPLTGETAVSLFRTLQEADQLLGALREQMQPTPVAATPTPTGGSRLEGVERYPAPVRPVAQTAVTASQRAVRPSDPAVARCVVPAGRGRDVPGRRVELARRGWPHSRPGRSDRCLPRTVCRSAATRPSHGRGGTVGHRARTLGDRRSRRAPCRLARHDRRRAAGPDHRFGRRNRRPRAAGPIGLAADDRTRPHRSGRRPHGRGRRAMARSVAAIHGHRPRRPARTRPHRHHAAERPAPGHLDRYWRARLAVRRDGRLRHGRQPHHLRSLRR